MTAETGTRNTAPRKVVLYGREELARLVCYCLTHDSPFEVAGFTVAEAEMPAGGDPGENLFGLPLIPFEKVEDRFPPDSHDLLVAIGPHRVNGPRAARFAEGRDKGYGFASYISSGAHLWPDLEIGPGCMCSWRRGSPWRASARSATTASSASARRCATVLPSRRAASSAPARWLRSRPSPTVSMSAYRPGASQPPAT